MGVILGHNYSLFLRFQGGAGAGPCLGAALSLWPGSALIVFSIGLAVFVFVGYACLTTLSVGLTVTVLFAYRYFALGTPVEYVYFGLGACLLLLWTLQPNLRRLVRGEERAVGLRAKRLRQTR